jgi:hypothetical protein
MRQQRKRDKRLTVVSRRKPWDARALAQAVATHINDQLVADLRLPTPDNEASA